MGGWAKWSWLSFPALVILWLCYSMKPYCIWSYQEFSYTFPKDTVSVGTVLQHYLSPVLQPPTLESSPTMRQMCAQLDPDTSSISAWPSWKCFVPMTHQMLLLCLLVIILFPCHKYLSKVVCCKYCSIFLMETSELWGYSQWISFITSHSVRKPKRALFWLFVRRRELKLCV